MDGTLRPPHELVAFERGPRARIEEVSRVQIVVSVKPVEGSMKLVGSALGNGAELPSRLDPVLGSIEAGLDLELLDGIRVGVELDYSVGLADLGSVQHRVIVGPTHAPDAEAHALSLGQTQAPRLHARGQGTQRAKDVSGVQGQIVDLLVVDHLPLRWRFRLQDGCLLPGLRPLRRPHPRSVKCRSDRSVRRPVSIRSAPSS